MHTMAIVVVHFVQRKYPKVLYHTTVVGIDKQRWRLNLIVNKMMSMDNWVITLVKYFNNLKWSRIVSRYMMKLKIVLNMLTPKSTQKLYLTLEKYPS